MTELLFFQVSEMIASTHRGDYVLRFVLDDSEWNWQAYAYFHGHDGSHCSVGPCLGDSRDVTAACYEHAARQPAHPPMRGWPACGELEVAHG